MLLRDKQSLEVSNEKLSLVHQDYTVEPLIYDPPRERPPTIYDHISCNGW